MAMRAFKPFPVSIDPPYMCFSCDERKAQLNCETCSQMICNNCTYRDLATFKVKTALLARCPQCHSENNFPALRYIAQ